MKKHLIMCLLMMSTICLAACNQSNSLKNNNSSESSGSSNGSSGSSGGNTNTTKTYTVTWKNYDGAILEVDRNVKEGSYPSYDGATPTRPSDSSYSYSWIGWTPTITAVNSNKTYYAKTIATPLDTNYSFDNTVTIVKGTSYWFKCEPIVWNILNKTSNKYLVLSSVLLDSHPYSTSTTRTIDGETVYPNNYKYSDVRNWLNNDFLDSIFFVNNSYIQTTTVDNSAKTTNNGNIIYACENTHDKLFPLSYQDYINQKYGFSSTPGSLTGNFVDRYCKTTEWARATGAYSDKSINNNGYYSTRSPFSNDKSDAYFVNPSGILMMGFNGIWFAGHCVRPAMTLII